MAMCFLAEGISSGLFVEIRAVVIGVHMVGATSGVKRLILVSFQVGNRRVGPNSNQPCLSTTSFQNRQDCGTRNREIERQGFPLRLSLCPAAR